MTKKQLIDELSAKVIAVTEHPPEATNWDGYQSITVDYLYERGGNIVQERSQMYVDAQDNAWWLKSEPNILRSQSSFEAKVNEKQVIEYVEGLSASYNVLDVQIRPRQTDDTITVEIDDGAKVLRKTLKAWAISAEPWSQPAGAHDAIAPGEYRTHNGKTWKNIHTDGNAWEPGTTNSQWAEVEKPYKIREMGNGN